MHIARLCGGIHLVAFVALAGLAEGCAVEATSVVDAGPRAPELVDAGGLLARDDFAGDGALATAAIGGPWTCETFGGASTQAIADGALTIAGAGLTECGVLSDVGNVDAAVTITLLSDADDNAGAIMLRHHRFGEFEWRISSRTHQLFAEMSSTDEADSFANSFTEDLDSAHELDLPSATSMRLRFRATDQEPATLQAKLWRADEQEPREWLSTQTVLVDAPLPQRGSVGVLAVGANESAAIRFDDFVAFDARAVSAEAPLPVAP